MPKKLQVLDQVHFKKNYNDWIRPPLVIFLSFFEKKYNYWIKCKLSKSQTKWTGLQFFSLISDGLGSVIYVAFPF